MKYSIVMPVFNGYETLKYTIPEMLSINRDDFEIVISENHSDDQTFDYLSSINDNRLKIYQPEEKINAGLNLRYAYSKAKGVWQSHLGDDDIILGSRFKILDKIINDNSQVELIRGEYLRYIWPDYDIKNEANKLIPDQFYTGEIKSFNSIPDLDELINNVTVYGGGSWVINKELINRIINKVGFLIHPQNLEFFTMRVALALSKKSIFIDLPIWILGRHSRSSGTQVLTENKNLSKKSWEWSFEDPDRFEFSPIHYKGPTSISFDGMLRSLKFVKIKNAENEINYVYWYKKIIAEIEYLITIKKLESGIRKEFWAWLGKEKFFIKKQIYVYHIKIFFYLNIPFIKKVYVFYKAFKKKKPSNYLFGWRSGTDVNKHHGVKNIVELARFIDDLILKYSN